MRVIGGVGPGVLFHSRKLEPYYPAPNHRCHQERFSSSRGECLGIGPGPRGLRSHNERGRASSINRAGSFTFHCYQPGPFSSSS